MILPIAYMYCVYCLCDATSKPESRDKWISTVDRANTWKQFICLSEECRKKINLLIEISHYTHFNGYSLFSLNSK